jgi:hypothetical protein
MWWIVTQVAAVSPRPSAALLDLREPATCMSAELGYRRFNSDSQSRGRQTVMEVRYGRFFMRIPPQIGIVEDTPARRVEFPILP